MNRSELSRINSDNNEKWLCSLQEKGRYLKDECMVCNKHPDNGGSGICQTEKTDEGLACYKEKVIGEPQRMRNDYKDVPVKKWLNQCCYIEMDSQTE